VRSNAARLRCPGWPCESRDRLAALPCAVDFLLSFVFGAASAVKAVSDGQPRRGRLSRRPLSRDRRSTAAADSDVVLRVAGGIIRIAAGIIRAVARLSGRIDRLIGVAAGERERQNRKDDTEPDHRPPLLPE
jgi:hypothetical protein